MANSKAIFPLAEQQRCLKAARRNGVKVVEMEAGEFKVRHIFDDEVATEFNEFDEELGA